MRSARLSDIRGSLPGAYAGDVTDPSCPRAARTPSGAHRASPREGAERPISAVPATPGHVMQEAIELLDTARQELAQVEGEAGSACAEHARAAAAAIDGAMWRLLGAAAHDARRSRRAAPELTPREVEIAQLIVAEELSNGEIAAQLFISEKTVKAHVGSILRKCGQTQRAGIALVLSAPDLVRMHPPARRAG